MSHPKTLPAMHLKGGIHQKPTLPGGEGTWEGCFPAWPWAMVGGRSALGKLGIGVWTRAIPRPGAGMILPAQYYRDCNCAPSERNCSSMAQTAHFNSKHLAVCGRVSNWLYGCVRKYHRFSGLHNTKNYLLQFL